MAREPVVSSSIAGIGYSSSSRTLEVEFNGGGVYEYVEVSAEEYAALMVARSKGQHLNFNIKGRYACRRLSP